MAQSYDKYELDNDNGKAFRLALNDILEASATQNSGPNSPNTSNTSYPYQVWVDETNDIVKIRDAATAGSWYSLYSVDSDGKPTGAVSYGSYTIATNDTAGNGGTTAITVNTSQHVGIGTSATPSGLINLTVNKASGPGSIQLAHSGASGGAIFPGSAGGLEFYTYTGSIGSENYSERMRIDSSGNVGIGNTTPGSYNSYGLPLVVTNSGSLNGGITIASSSSGTGNIHFADGTSGGSSYRGIIQYNHTDDSMSLHTTEQSRLRITNTGQILADSLTAGISTGITAKTIGLWTPSSNSSISWCSGSSSPSGRFVAWYDISLDRLQITDADYSHGVVLNQNSNSWGSYSDARLKENIELLENSLEKVKAIQPRGFTWKSTGDYDIGFVAQELKLIVPEAVDGNEDDFHVNEETGITHGAMSVKTDKLIPILTKALQEAIAKIETLEAKVAALESA